MGLADTYIQYGVPSNWAKDYESTGIPATTFRITSPQNLISKYNIPKFQVSFVKNCLTRQPIEEKTLQKLLERSRFVCCLCKGQKSNAYIIHHIIEYSKTQHNSYENLAVLCPNDHEHVHRPGSGALAQSISKKQIIEAKKSWEKEVKILNKEKALVKIINPKGINPFKELQSYTENDKEFFFGRDTEMEELVAKLFKHNVVGLFGESGTGKTSLLNAAIVPDLRSKGFLQISVRCLDEPVKRIREALQKHLKINKATETDLEELMANDTFPHFVLQLKATIEKWDKNLIIIIDQFEEIFTRASETEREEFAKGLTEALVGTKRKMFFLLSLREDYIGELWDWTHSNNLEAAWIQQYRIKRLNEKKAFEVITKPLSKLGISVDDAFIQNLISELKAIGDDLIYPPYLQIVCSELFEKYKLKNPELKSTVKFDKTLYGDSETAESIIAEYLSESMLNGLTAQEKLIAQSILDLLTGPEGLRTYLTTKEIARYLSIDEKDSEQIVEHLIKKKIVHPVIESDLVIGYELVHDFLSRKFFEKLGPEVKKLKTTIEIFRKAFKEFTLHGILASKDQLEILASTIPQLKLSDEELVFLVKSSFSVYWWYKDNKILPLIDQGKVIEICIALIDDKREEIVENAIRTLGSYKPTTVTDLLRNIIISSKRTAKIREVALDQFWFNITDYSMLDTFKEIILTYKEHKLRKAAIYAYGNHVKNLSLNITEPERLQVIYSALNDKITNVRKQAADVFYYTIVHKSAYAPLMDRLKVEPSVNTRKALVLALGSLAQNGEQVPNILATFNAIMKDDDEDYKVVEEAKRITKMLKRRSQ